MNFKKLSQQLIATLLGVFLGLSIGATDVHAEDRTDESIAKTIHAMARDMGVSIPMSDFEKAINRANGFAQEASYQVGFSFRVMSCEKRILAIKAIDRGERQIDLAIKELNLFTRKALFVGAFEKLPMSEKMRLEDKKALFEKFKSLIPGFKVYAESVCDPAN